jgi:SAM-dependent methyltransferase
MNENAAVISLKSVIKPLLPQVVIDAWRAQAAARIDAQFAHSPPVAVFSEIYRQRLWGTSNASAYCSGQGSHNEAVVQPYLHALRAFLSQFPTKPNVVDLGCGDFNVGAQLRDAGARYIACDVVPDLVEHNRTVFKHLDVSFVQTDITSDSLPYGDVALIRQVLQHLSNEQIKEVARKLRQYPWIVVTEHLPTIRNFTANLDKPVGPGTRLRLRSGVVLTAPPFDLGTCSHRLLCSVPDSSGVLQTTAYHLRP